MVASLSLFAYCKDLKRSDDRRDNATLNLTKLTLISAFAYLLISGAGTSLFSYLFRETFHYWRNGDKVLPLKERRKKTSSPISLSLNIAWFNEAVLPDQLFSSTCGPELARGPQGTESVPRLWPRSSEKFSDRLGRETYVSVGGRVCP